MVLGWTVRVVVALGDGFEAANLNAAMATLIDYGALRRARAMFQSVCDTDERPLDRYMNDNDICRLFDASVVRQTVHIISQPVRREST